MNEIDLYIAKFPEETQQYLKEIRRLILNEVPTAVESMSYGMPVYKLSDKPLVYFAGYKNHIGLYALPNTHLQFKDELAGYKQGKGSVQFPMSVALPMDLMRRMIAFRVTEIS